MLRGPVTASDIRPLKRVAMEAGKGEVTGDGGAVVLFGDDVIDLEEDRVEDLGHEAVFAGASGTTPHQFDERLVHEGTPRALLPCHLLEGSARPGVKNTEQTTSICVAEEFLAFFG